MIDIVIIGGGPAGVASAVYSARKQLTTALVVKEFGGQSVVSPEIFNWIGDKSISGTELAHKLKEHSKEYEGEYLTIHENEEVTSLEKSTEGFIVKTSAGTEISARTVLVASGSGRRKLEITGADTYEGKGVVYCASCDGPLFSGQDVAVIGGGNAGFESAAQLSAYCKSVSIIHRGPAYKADSITVEKVLEKENVVGFLNTDPIEIKGEQFVTGLVVRDKDAGEERTLAVAGIFVEIGQIPNNQFLGDVTDLDPYGRIIVDPRTQRANTEGIWAAGDITDGLYHQNNIAAGDAVKAIENIYLFLHAGK